MSAKYRVTTLDPDTGKYTPQKGLRCGPYSKWGLRLALRRLESAYTVRPRRSANFVLVERYPKKEPPIMKIEVGTRVAYSVQFLKSISMSHSFMAHARGRVIDLALMSPHSGTVLATIEWDSGADMPTRVNLENLAAVGPNSKFAAV